jgi:hypothetical protein
MNFNMRKIVILMVNMITRDHLAMKKLDYAHDAGLKGLAQTHLHDAQFL